MLTVSFVEPWDLVAVTQMLFVLEDVQIQQEYVGQETAEHQAVCVLKAELVDVRSVQLAHHCIAVLLLTVIVPAVRTMITAEQFVIILRASGLLVLMAATLIDVVDSHVQRLWDAKVRVFVRPHYT
jgi:hypothetical protein